VIGSGQMGQGIAHVAALAGYQGAERAVRRPLKSAMATINGNLSRQVSRNLTEDSRKAVLDRTSPGDHGRIAYCDLVIETAGRRSKRSSARSSTTSAAAGC